MESNKTARERFKEAGYEYLAETIRYAITKCLECGEEQVEFFLKDENLTYGADNFDCRSCGTPESQRIEHCFFNEMLEDSSLASDHPCQSEINI